MVLFQATREPTQWDCWPSQYRASTWTVFCLCLCQSLLFSPPACVCMLQGVACGWCSHANSSSSKRQRSLPSLSTLDLMVCLHLIAVSSLEPINVAFLGPRKSNKSCCVYLLVTRQSARVCKTKRNKTKQKPKNPCLWLFNWRKLLLLRTQLNGPFALEGTALSQPHLLICWLLMDTDSRLHLGRDSATVLSCPWAGLVQVRVTVRSAAGIWPYQDRGAGLARPTGPD